MPEMSGKLNSNPTKTNNLIYIMIFFEGGVKKILGGVKKFSARFAQHSKYLPPPYRILIYAPGLKPKNLKSLSRRIFEKLRKQTLSKKQYLLQKTHE